MSLYLDQEVRAKGLTPATLWPSPASLEAVSFSHGTPLNVSAVARECEVQRKVVTGYVGILEDLLMAFRLPVFHKRVKRTAAARDKLYPLDAEVFCSLRPQGTARPARGD